MAADAVIVVGQTREFSLPVWRMVHLLSEERSRWLALEAGETAPEDVEAEWGSVRWTSLWTDRPRDQMLVEVSDGALGSRLRWTLLSPEDDTPDEARIRLMRHRVNELLNVLLRDYVEAQG